MRIPTSNGVIENRQTSTGQIRTEATTQATSNLGFAMQFVQKYKKEKDISDTQEAINEATKRKLEWKASNLTREGKAAQGLTEDFLKFSQDIEPDLTANMSENAKKMFRDWHLKETDSDKFQIIGYQKKQDEFVKKASLTEGLTLAQEAIRQDAKSNWGKAIQDAETHLALGLESGAIRPEEFDTVRTNQVNSLRAELGKSYYTQDKHDFIKNINQFGFGETEKAAYLDKYQKDLRAEERELKLLNQEEAKLIMSKEDDMLAQARANKDTSFLKENSEKLKQMGFSEWASRLEERAGEYDAVISFDEEHKGKSLSEKMTAAESIEIPNELDGSSNLFKAKTAIQKEVAKERKLFETDPAQYVKHLVQGTTPEEQADSRLSIQSEQGPRVMPKGGYKVLTKEETTYYKNAWESGRPEQRAELLKETFKYGKHTSKVIKEMGLNASLSLVPFFAEDDKGMEMLVHATDDKAIILDSESTQKKEYTAAAQSSKFYQLLTKVQGTFPINNGLDKKIQDVEKAMIGVSAKRLAPDAGAAFFDERFNIIDEGDKMIFFGKTADEDEVLDALDTKKAILMESRKDRLGQMALRGAVWVNTEGNGFALADPKTGLPVPGSEVPLKEIDVLADDAIQRRKMKVSRFNEASNKNLRTN